MTDHIPEYLQSHVIAGDRVAVSIDEQGAALLASLKPGSRSAVTLVKEHGTSVVLLALAAGNRVNEHRAPGVVTVQVVRGRVGISHGGSEVDAPAGTLVAFAPGEAHSLDAIEESAVLVTVAPPTS